MQHFPAVNNLLLLQVKLTLQMHLKQNSISNKEGMKLLLTTESSRR